MSKLQVFKHQNLQRLRSFGKRASRTSSGIPSAIPDRYPQARYGANNMSLRSFIKGWIGETVGAISQKLLLDPKIYFPLNNITLQTANGTTQIDHIIVSKYGIFVIEAKNMSGWIFGDAKSAQWTQSLFGKKYRFQNPLHQNYRHTKALQEFLGVDESKLISLVMFWGECEFKTPMPDNVRCSGYISFIKRYTATLLSDAEVQQFVAAIQSG